VKVFILRNSTFPIYRITEGELKLREIFWEKFSQVTEMKPGGIPVFL